MFRKSIVSLAIGSVCCAAGAGALLTRSATAAAAVPGGVQVVPMATKAEDVNSALQHLRRAQSMLAKADHDEKGLDYEALKSTEKAIEQCEKYMQQKGWKVDKDRDNDDNKK